jgi:phosphoglycolate phosphatase
VRGLIFDLDGTLVDSYDAIGESLDHAMSSLGLARLDRARVRKLVGRGLESLLERAMAEVGAPGRDAGLIEAGVRLFRDRYDAVCEGMTRLLPGVDETLRDLDERGMAMAVATNKPSYFAKRILDSLSVGGHLRAVYGPDLVPRPKPHPDMLGAVLSSLGIRREEAIYIGDMEVDVETARAAGVRVILVPTGSCSLEEIRAAGADLVLPDFRSLRDLFPRDGAR